ncbi:MAG TPA: hypothetical protein VGY53_06335 [Isosphaeraceae bacterium]|nr:hypothetical protein [Isosphaeraceae bacterium]
MKTQELAVLSLRPDPSHPLGLDLKHILAALQRDIPDWVWCVKNLDWLGENGESLCNAVQAAGPGGFWFDSQDLVKVVKGIYQTVEGEFIAFPRSIDRRALGPQDLSLSSFPSSRAVAAIVAVDGCYFDVYSKDSQATSRLHETFPGATVEDPPSFISSSVAAGGGRFAK